MSLPAIASLWSLLTRRRRGPGVAVLAVLLAASGARAQQPDTAKAGMRNIELANVDVAPSAIDTHGWLLMNPDIKMELDGGVTNLYNFKFDKAERQFRSLRRRYEQHPLPYFMMGLSAWWKILPTNVTTKRYDKIFFAYMDTATTKAEALYEQDQKNYEACFFLSAAYAFSSRLHAERHDWPRATIEAKRALSYLNKSREANGLSPEFLFGEALFNYYAVWIGEEFPWLRPVLLLFPKGNKELGLLQLRNVADNAVYTGPEAKFFLMKILTSEREGQAEAAFPIARGLAADYPDNPYFQRIYAMQCFNRGEFRECERVSLDILDKLTRGQVGYDGFSGRYATYYLGFIQEKKYKDLTKAKAYYERCIVFSESTDQVKSGYYRYANLSMASIAIEENDLVAARRYYKAVLASADRDSEMYQEADEFMKANKRSATSRKAERNSRPLVREGK